MNSVRPILPPQDVQIWQIDLRGSPEKAVGCLAPLSSDERGRAARCVSPEDQQHFVIARGALRIILAGYLGVNPASLEFVRQARGKPELPGCPLHFNLSHSGERALLAVSADPVGVDIEEIRPLDDAAAVAMIFSAEERAAMAVLPAPERSRRFLQAWVRREARLKARGLTITDACPEIPVYDLDVGPDFLAAVATAIRLPQIVQLHAGP